MNHRLIFVTLSGLAWLTAGLIAIAGPPGQTITAADEAELRQIEPVLLDPTAHERSGAARTLANLASRYTVTPRQIRALLSRAAEDIDPEIASIASDALSRSVEAQAWADLDLEDTYTSENANPGEIERISTLLADPADHERSGAGLQLVNLAGTYPSLPSEVRSLLEQALDDGDPRVAEPAAAFLAQAEGRPPRRPAPGPLSDEAAEDFEEELATLQGPASHEERWLALARLRDMPLPAAEQQIRAEAFQLMLLEDDPMIRNHASFAFAAVLTGSTDALAQVHVGSANPPDSLSGLQPEPTAGPGKNDSEPGYFTKAGVFVGTTPQAEDPPWLQPPSDQRPGRPELGYVDEFGVFIGAIPITQSGGDEQQPPP